MATILTQPDSLSFSRNLKRFEISSSGDVHFKLTQGATTIIDESYTPNSFGRVVVDIAAVISNYISIAVPTGNIYNQQNAAKQFTVEIDDLPAVIFVAVKGGVENLADTAANFLAANWLSWQPQVKKVSYSQPEWLTYYATAAAVVKVKLYFKDGSSTIVTLASQSAGSCYSYNMQFAHIMTLAAGEKYGYYDAWVENLSGTRLTYIQRYAYRETGPDDEVFVFENSLGGVDTACMTGESNFTPAADHQIGIYEDVAVQIDNYFTRLYDKSTGWLSKSEANWVVDFFHSAVRYKLDAGTLRKIALKESSISDSSQEDLKSYSFVYRFSEDRGLLNIPRSMDVPTNLEISTPESLFFLAPRLVDFPAATLQDDLLFPVQSPFAQLWQKLSWGAIWNFLYDKILTSAIGVMAHVHDNLAVLGGLSEDAGKLKYKGESIVPDTGFGVQLGESSSTAYRGDRGKSAYDHSQNANVHFTDASQKNAVINSLSSRPLWIDQVTNGLLVTTQIPNIADAGYIVIEISGFGKVDAGPFIWRGQALFTGGAFADATIKSVYAGELLDVRIFVHDALVKMWITGLSKAIMNFQNIQVLVRFGDSLENQVDDLVDSAMLTGVVSLKEFNNFTKSYIRPLTTEEQNTISKAVVSADLLTNYKIWCGSSADYASLTKDANTLYFIQ